MKQWGFRIFLLLVLAAAIFWGWRVWFPGPDQIIRKRLTQLAQLASVAPNESPLKKVANAQQLANFFTPDVEISVDIPGRTSFNISGRDEVRDNALGASALGASFTVEFVDVSVTVAPGAETAVVRLTAKANVRGETMPQVQELKVDFKKVDKDWLVNHVDTVRTLR